MNSLMLFLFCFLAVAFSLILIQKDLTKWQKFSLVLNPAVLALCIMVLITKSKNDTDYAADVAPVANATAELLQTPGTPTAKKAAERIRLFSADPADQNWKKLAEDLKNLAIEQKKSQKK